MPGLSMSNKEAIPYIRMYVSAHSTPGPSAALPTYVCTYMYNIYVCICLHVRMHVHLYMYVCIYFLEYRALCDIKRIRYLPYYVHISVCVHMYATHVRTYVLSIIVLYVHSQSRPTSLYQNWPWSRTG